MQDDNDFIFGRLDNERKRIEEQKRLNAQKVKDSERNWLSQVLLDFGKALGKGIAFAFELLGR